MTYAADASVLVSALADDGEEGRWALDLLEAVPHLVLVEAANIVRRLERSGELSREMAVRPHQRLIHIV